MNGFDRLLIVEDNSQDIELITKSMSNLEGVNLKFCDSIKSAVNIISEEDIDLVVASSVLPDGKGSDLINLKKIDKQVPVILMFNQENRNDIFDALKMGAVDCIVKSPEKFNELSLIVLKASVCWNKIKQQKEIEKKFKESQNKLWIQETYFETLVNEAPVAIAILDNQDRVERLNKKFESMFGYSQSEAVGCQINDLIVPDALKDEGMTATLDVAKGEQVFFETVRKTKTGKELQVSIIGKPVLFKKDQIAVFGIYQDISDRKVSEIKLRELSERLMLAAESAGIGIWDYEIKNKKLVWESEMFKLLGLEEDDSRDLIDAFREAVVSEDADRVLNNIFNINKAGGHYEDRFRVKDQSNNTKFIKIVASEFKNGKPVPIRVIGACWDVTKEVEHSELKNKVEIADKVSSIKQQFVANMSHEIRSPLTGILGMSGLLLKTKLEDKQKHYAEIILSSSKSLLNIVNDILDLSKIEAGKMELKPVVFNIKESGAKIYKLFYALVQQQKLQLRINFDEKLPENIYADEHRLSQIITNLVSNAVKFTEKGTVKLSYILENQSDYSYKIKVVVEDSGIGISKENQEKLFNIFSQADTSDTRTYEGTGLGLAICKRMAELMGGTINMESYLGKGSKFWFTFMAKKVSDEQSLVESEVHDEVVKVPKPFSILLVEDKKTNQLVISLMLEEAGCKTDIASNGQEALKKFNPGEYDFILMDIQMPVMDGVTAVKELKNRYGSSALPTIIGLSAKAMEGDAEYYLSQGMDDYLTKPVSTSKLVEKFIYWSDKKNES